MLDRDRDVPVRHAIVALLLASAFVQSARANNRNLDRLNEVLAGKVVDFTRNHGADRRLYSTVLNQYRDLYVYLPPGYTGAEPSNLIVWFHGAFGDEQIAFFLSRIEILDRLIACGASGPTVVVFPDCTVSGLSNPLAAHSFMVNGRAGGFEDHLFKEVIPFVERTYNVKRNREGRALAGVSAGGFAALSIGMRNRQQFSTISALGPPANLRCGNVNNDYFEDFDPATYRWREDYKPRQVIGKFFGGAVRLRVAPFVNPIFGPQNVIMENIRRTNPADLLFTENIQPNELQIYLNYPKRDNFNFDAQAESFIHFARQKGLPITAIRDEQGAHTVDYFHEAMPTMWKWLARRLPGGRREMDVLMHGDLPIQDGDTSDLRHYTSPSPYFNLPPGLQQIVPLQQR